jgi:hypothetical protein
MAVKVGKTNKCNLKHYFVSSEGDPVKLVFNLQYSVGEGGVFSFMIAMIHDNIWMLLIL